MVTFPIKRYESIRIIGLAVLKTKTFDWTKYDNCNFTTLTAIYGSVATNENATYTIKGAMIWMDQSQTGLWEHTAYCAKWQPSHRGACSLELFTFVTRDWTQLRLQKMCIARARNHMYRWRVHLKCWTRLSVNCLSKLSDSPPVGRGDGSLAQSLI